MQINGSVVSIHVATFACYKFSFVFFSLDIEHFNVQLELVESLFADRNMAPG